MLFGKMNKPDENQKYLLKTIDGKVAYTYDSDEIKVRDTQLGNEHYVIVKEHPMSDKSVCMSFKFTNNYLFVDGDTLKVKPQDKLDFRDKSYLFKWGSERGRARSLVSVAQSKCLILSKNRTISISSGNKSPLLFKLEKCTK